MINKAISLGICLMMYIASFAQPGYMGKIFSFGYHMEATPIPSIVTSIDEYSDDAISRRNIQEYDNERKMNWVFGHSFNAGCAVTRKKSLFLNAAIRNRNIYLQILKYDNLNQGTDPSSYGGEPYLEIEPLDMELDAREVVFDFGFRKYFADYIAPIGIYWQLSLGQSRLKYKDRNEPISVLSNNLNVDLIAFDKTVVANRFGAGIGIMRTISKAIYFSASADAYLVFHSGGRVKLSEVQEGTPENDYLKDNLKANMKVYDWLSLKFGIGILL